MEKLIVNENWQRLSYKTNPGKNVFYAVEEEVFSDHPHTQNANSFFQTQVKFLTFFGF